MRTTEDDIIIIGPGRVESGGCWADGRENICLSTWSLRISPSASTYNSSVGDSYAQDSRGGCWDHPAIMSEIKVFNTPCLDLECFLSAKAKLRQEGLLDPVLKANLEYAIQALESMPAAKRSNASLLGAIGPQLQQKIYVGAQLTRSSVTRAHFAGHRCQDEFEPCLEQAQKAIPDDGLASVELRVVCNELQLTYVTHQPSATITVTPCCRVNLGRALSLQKALEVKNWMEQRGMMGKGLLACFQHLLVSYSQYQAENAKLVLQSEGQIIELISGRPDYHNVKFYIFADANNEIQSQRVQDIDLWDYD
ncbi:hypothetical protein GJAV_G00002790 [Gymnothorax javanicus]|nr:hypothetical protein GJAV_G00002790 [Gymnothorax javanicus]